MDLIIDSKINTIKKDETVTPWVPTEFSGLTILLKDPLIGVKQIAIKRIHLTRKWLTIHKGFNDSFTFTASVLGGSLLTTVILAEGWYWDPDDLANEIQSKMLFADPDGEWVVQWRAESTKFDWYGPITFGEPGYLHFDLSPGLAYILGFEPRKYKYPTNWVDPIKSPYISNFLNGYERIYMSIDEVETEDDLKVNTPFNNNLIACLNCSSETYQLNNYNNYWQVKMYNYYPEDASEFWFNISLNLTQITPRFWVMWGSDFYQIPTGNGHFIIELTIHTEDTIKQDETKKVSLY